MTAPGGPSKRKKHQPPTREGWWFLGATLLAPGKGFAPIFSDAVPAAVPAAGSKTRFLLDIIPSTFTSAFTGGNSLQILLLATLSGIALGRVGERGRLLNA